MNSVQVANISLTPKFELGGNLFTKTLTFSIMHILPTVPESINEYSIDICLSAAR